jgi:signal transduction histidine kinase
MITSADIEDLRFLAASEAERRDLTLAWENEIETGVSVPAQPVRQIALNLLLNACAAAPPGSIVRFRAYEQDAALCLEVVDQGPGLPEAPRRLLLDGAEAPLPTASGLGIWTVSRLIKALHGEISVGAAPGTSIAVRLPSEAYERTLASAA